jgi:hypothetical protein
MAITKELLDEKLAGLRKQQQEVIAQANALGGAIQIVEQLIADLSTTREDQP